MFTQEGLPVHDRVLDGRTIFFPKVDHHSQSSAYSLSRKLMSYSYEIYDKDERDAGRKKEDRRKVIGYGIPK